MLVDVATSEEQPVDITALPTEILTAILRRLSHRDPNFWAGSSCTARSLHSFLSASGVSRNWRNIALPLIHNHGKSGFWFLLCVEFDPALASLSNVASYWRLHTQMQVNYLPEIQLADLQFLIDLTHDRGVFLGGSCIRKFSTNFLGADATCYITAVGEVDHQDPDDEYTEAGSWFWTVHGLVATLGWDSIRDGQAAADEQSDFYYNVDDLDEEELERREMERWERDEPYSTTLARVRVLHTPSQRVLHLVNGGRLKSRPRHERDEPLHELVCMPERLRCNPKMGHELGDFLVGVNLMPSPGDEDACRVSVSFERPNGDLIDKDLAMIALRHAAGWMR